jgi:nitroimidazol reductase NimA-like FMN-containing flavoprotein (pyridoxamine 5'-phosphate oxidase superfamily)
VTPLRLRGSTRTTGKRHPERYVDDPAGVRALLAEGFLATVGFVEAGEPRLVPTCYAVSGDTLYLHGSTGSGWLSRLADGRQVCVSIFCVDGLVLADTVMNHSVNFRSLTLFGALERVTGREHEAAMRAVVEQIVPGRSAELPAPSAKDLAATTVLALPLGEASLKQRNGGPSRTTEHPPAWTGTLPRRDSYGPPEPDPLAAGLPVPGYLTAYRQAP